MQLDVGAYQRVLGDELRRLRKNRGLTRRDLNHRLQRNLSLQTLATYELGTRQCSVVRLVEICMALEESPATLLARVNERFFGVATPGRILVDLRKVVQSDQPDLAPFQRWAAEKLLEGGNGTGPGDVSLDISALERMAELCGLETVDLIARIRSIAGPL